MAGKGGPYGNQHNKKGREWTDALRRALARESGSIGKGLNELADAVVKAAKYGDNPVITQKDAITEIANRVEGKPVETVESHVTGSLDVNLNKIDAVRARLRPSKSDTSSSD